MSADKDRDALIEQAAGAYRELRDGQVGASPAWYDLDEEARKEAHSRAMQSRELEAALDAEGLSSTAKAVLRRIISRAS